MNVVSMRESKAEAKGKQELRYDLEKPVITVPCHCALAWRDSYRFDGIGFDGVSPAEHILQCHDGIPKLSLTDSQTRATIVDHRVTVVLPLAISFKKTVVGKAYFGRTLTTLPPNRL